MAEQHAQRATRDTPAVGLQPVVGVMVVHEPGSWFAETLGSLAAQDYPHLRWLVLVTGAEDEERTAAIRARVLGSLPDAVVRSVRGNPGFGPLASQVLRLVEGNAGYFCFLHDDVALEPDAITTLVAELVRSNAGAAGPKLVDWDDPTVLQSVGLAADGLGEIDPVIEPGEKDQEQHDAVRDVFLVPSVCLMVRADLFREIGGFAPDIAFFGEDLDLCWRVHLSGARVLVVPDARVRHRSAIVERTGWTNSATERARNRVRTVVTLSSRYRLPLIVLRIVLFAILRLPIGVFTGTYRESLAALRATVGVVLDARYVFARRAEVRPYRRVPSSEIHDLQVRGSAPVVAWLRRRRASRGGSWTTVETGDASTLRRNALALIALVATFLVGSRDVFTRGLAPVGEFLPLRSGSETPGALFGEYLGGWWHAGFGQAAAPPTGLALLGLAGVVFLWQLGALQTVSTIGAVLVGWAGVWSLVGRESRSSARLAATAAYGASVVPYAALGAGRWSVLLVYATAPWLLVGLGAFERRPASVARVGASLALLLAGVAAFVPGFLVVAVIVAVVWSASGLLGSAPLRTAAATVALATGCAVAAIALNAPWTFTLAGDRWLEAVAGVRPEEEGVRGLARVVRLDDGALLLGHLAPLLLLVPVLAILAVRGPRLVAAFRGLGLTVISLSLLVGLDAAVVPGPFVDPLLLVVAVALGVAVSAGALAAEWSSHERGSAPAAIRLLGSLAIAVGLVAATPAVVATADGRWSQPETTLAQLLAQLPPGDVDGDFAVAFVGRRDVVPTTGHRLAPGVSVAVAADGEITLRDFWQPRDDRLMRRLDDALTSAIDGSTLRAGRLLAPLSVRYVVAAFEEGDEEVRDLALRLGEQLDFRRTYSANDLVILENLAWIPSLAVLDEGTALLSRSADDASLLAGRLGVSRHLPRSGVISSRPSFVETSTVHLAVAYSDRLGLVVSGVRVQPRIAFGATTAFDSPVPGIAVVDYATPITHRLLVALQALAWLGTLVVATDALRYRRRVARVAHEPVRLEAVDPDADASIRIGGG